ncbi:MAG: recombinase family protein [Anaerolineae bacterium]|nr:recombinase family protein [Anaerolineae bacterium]MCO5205557.1 recombinase family protein [Anaerolineae bacterium]
MSGACARGRCAGVTQSDRFAFSILHLCQIAAELEEKGVALQVLDQNIETNDANSRLLLCYLLV